MFNTAAGVNIPFPDKIEEKYELSAKRILCNISFEKLKQLLGDFVCGLVEPLFLVIELPLKLDEEEKLRTSQKDVFHKEVLYLDGQKKKQIDTLLDQYGELLLNDGMSSFGVASHVTGDEILIQKYKVVAIYSGEITKYCALMNRYGIVQTDNLVTVWNTFSHEHPGTCELVSINGLSVYDIVEELKKQGMYSSEIKIDD